MTVLIANVFSYDRYHKTGQAIDAIRNVPLKIEGWVGMDLPLEERVYRILETKSIIHRRYISNNQTIFLSLVYYPETKVDFHSPEGCLGGKVLKSKTH